VRGGELFVCVGRICAPRLGRAYALAVLAIGALGESVSLSDMTKPREAMPRKTGQQP
jgi:hypothetical protein